MYSLEPVFVSLKAAHAALAQHTGQQKNAALESVAHVLDANRSLILKANALDVAKATSNGMKEALIDRLRLNDNRIDSIINSIAVVVQLNDPVGKVRAGWTTANGLFIQQVTVPLGVAAIIYESRPNVTVDAFSLAYKAGCAILLRGSSSALESNRTLVALVRQGLEQGNGISEAVALADSGRHEDVDAILEARNFIDVVLPRGGRELIRRVVENAHVPVIETGEGNCHIYVDKDAELKHALDIIENAKVQKPGACNAVETLLVHSDMIATLMPPLAARLAGTVELRCDKRAKAAIGTAPATLALRDADEADWKTEFLDYILAVKTVDTLDQAIAHINHYGTRHSEAILTTDLDAANQFQARVDAACVYVNASTRFTDGGEFGFGAELGISTQKFHARGPMGLEALTTVKYRIAGSGHIRRQ